MIAKKYINLSDEISEKMKLLMLGIISHFNDKRIKKINREITVKLSSLKDSKISINPWDWSQMAIFDEVLLNNAYDFRLLKFIPDYIYDCGAHIGLFSVKAAAFYPHSIISIFEPNPSNCILIKKQLAGNKIMASLFEAAVSNYSGETNFSVSHSHFGYISGKDEFNQGIRVKVIDFSVEIKKVPRNKKLLIKMDIEGEEQNVIPSIIDLLPDKTAIYFETHEGALGFEKIRNILKTNGFDVSVVEDRGDFIDAFAVRE